MASTGLYMYMALQSKACGEAKYVFFGLKIPKTDYICCKNKEILSFYMQLLSVKNKINITDFYVKFIFH